MTIVANLVHARLVNCWNALQVHPEYLAYMEPGLRDQLKEQAAYVAPLLIAAEKGVEDKTAADIEATYEATRTLIKQAHSGLDYLYSFKHSEQLKELAPLTLGLNPAEDEVRIGTLIRVLPTLRPPFQWIQNDSFTLAALVKGHKAQEHARQTDAGLGATAKGALEALRKARPASKLLWTEEKGLDAWIKAHIPFDQQYAFGRERRTRPRATASEPGTTTTAAPEDGKQAPETNRSPDAKT